MEQVQFSISTLNEVIAQKLKSLSSVTSAKDIKEINNFLRESQRLRKTLYSIGDIDEEYEEEAYVEGGDVDYMGVLSQCCDYIINLHAVTDYKKVKETKAQWLLDESADFLNELRSIFGGRIPVMPGSIEGRSEDVCVENELTEENKKPNKRK
jgi:hypothetical protein